jgi:hypothetical protein
VLQELSAKASSLLASRPKSPSPAPNIKASPARPKSGPKRKGAARAFLGQKVSGKHIAQAKESLLSGEVMEAIVTGRVKEVSTRTKGRFSFDPDSDKGGSFLKNYLIVTNQRVILWARGAFSKSTDAFEFSNIKSVEVQKGIMFGAIVLNIYGKTENFAQMNKKEAEHIADLIRKKVRHANQASQPQTATAAPPSALEQIEKLSELHQRGIITDAEFAEQKKKLLDRM